MKAAQINEYGEPSVIKVLEIDKPVPGAGQVLVEVQAASLNPFDSSVRRGLMKEFIPLQFPATLGGDIAGVVVAAGEGVTQWQAGDKVYGQAAVVAGNSGAFAEFAATAAGQVGRMPSTVDFTEAAALPLVGVSALQGLRQHIQLQAGQSIFIHGGAGGIGAAAVQLAKHLGATVATTATGEDIERVEALGADNVIDYKAADFATVLHNYDAVFDTVGGDDFNKALGVLKRGGIAVTMIARPDEARAAELGVTALQQSTQVSTAALDELTNLVESGVITPQVRRTFKLDDIVQAFEAREGGGVSGKVVVTMG